MPFLIFFFLRSLRIPQIRHDIQNLTDSPVCTQLWPLWVNLIICVCRPVRVLSLRGTVAPQPPPCFLHDSRVGTLVLAEQCWGRVETRHKPIFNQVAAVAFEHCANKKNQKPEQVGGRESSSHRDFLQNFFFVAYAEKIIKNRRQQVVQFEFKFLNRFT